MDTLHDNRRGYGMRLGAYKTNGSKFGVKGSMRFIASPSMLPCERQDYVRSAWLGRDPLAEYERKERQAIKAEIARLGIGTHKKDGGTPESLQRPERIDAIRADQKARFHVRKMFAPAPEPVQPKTVVMPITAEASMPQSKNALRKMRGRMKAACRA